MLIDFFDSDKKSKFYANQHIALLICLNSSVKKDLNRMN